MNISVKSHVELLKVLLWLQVPLYVWLAGLFYGAYKVSASDAPVLSGTSATYQLFSLCIIDIILLIGLTAYLYTFRKREKDYNRVIIILSVIALLLPIVITALFDFIYL
jgi:hypothetical protein